MRCRKQRSQNISRWCPWLEARSFLISITFARDSHPGDSHVMSWQKMSKRKNETWSNHVLHSCHHEHCFRGRSTCLSFILNMKEIGHISNLPLRVDKHRSHVACSFTNFCCLIMIKSPSLEELLHNSSNPDAKRTKKRNATSICPTFVLVTLRCITHSTGKRRCHRSQQPIEKAWSCASTRNSLSPGHSKSITDFSTAAKQCKKKPSTASMSPRFPKITVVIYRCLYAKTHCERHKTEQS